MVLKWFSKMEEGVGSYVIHGNLLNIGAFEGLTHGMRKKCIIVCDNKEYRESDDEINR